MRRIVSGTGPGRPAGANRRGRGQYTPRRASSAITIARQQRDDREPPVARLLRGRELHHRRIRRHGRRQQPLVQKPRQLGQRAHEVGRFGQQPALQRAQAELVLHPALEEGLRGDPQVQVGVELPAEAFDVEQRLLQQHELRLDLDVEAPRRPEQVDAAPSPSEISFNGRSKIGSQTTRISLSSSSTRVSGRHPSRLDVRGGDAAVIAAKERDEVLREVALVASRTACP